MGKLLNVPAAPINIFFELGFGLCSFYCLPFSLPHAFNPGLQWAKHNLNHWPQSMSKAPEYWARWIIWVLNIGVEIYEENGTSTTC